MKTCLRLAGVGVFVAMAAMGQSSERCPVRGEIVSREPRIGVLTVELSPFGSSPSARAIVNLDGSFDMPPVDPGYYEVRVLVASGVVLHSEMVSVSGCHQALSIRLPETTPAARPPDAAISVRQLIHKVPPQAKKAFDKGEQAESKKDHQQAVELFRQAVAIDPEYADAFNELGAAQAAQGEFAQAMDSFQKAIDVAPEHAIALANMSIVLAKLGRYDEAAVAARRALQFMPGSGTLRYILASSLLVAKGESDEVLDNLERCASDVPFAHLLAAEILAHRGKREEAAHHIEDYLRIVPAGDTQRPRAEAMLAKLRS